MNPLARIVVIAAALVAAPQGRTLGGLDAPQRGVRLAPAAVSGSPNARVEGPAKDGRYIVRTYARMNLVRRPNLPDLAESSDAADMYVVACAEGIVDGKRQTVPIQIGLTGEKGVYQFQRSWPRTGSWALRTRQGNQGPLAPVTVTELGPNGNVRSNRFIWGGDGIQQCVVILKGGPPRGRC